MKQIQILDDFLAALGVAESVEDLRIALETVKRAMGFDFFALTHHADICENRPRMIRLHDYPEAWARQFDRRHLGRIDPVHRASHRTVIGFPWTALNQMIDLSSADRSVINRARQHGIGEGFTIPTHVPGESTGSVSFAVAVGRPLPYNMLSILPTVASHAFETSRRLWHMQPPAPRPALTQRQRICLTWIMRGKSDWETSQIMGCQPDTVARHIKLARERYGVEKRTLLMALALLDGTLSLADLDFI